MDHLIIKSTDLAPEIQMDINGTILIKGRSMMENALLFYEPIHYWINEYIKK